MATGEDKRIIAQHRRTKQLAAVKEIATHKLSADFAKCLDAELAAMRGMHHPNIVSFYEQIQEQRRIYIVMEFCNEGELQKVIEKGRCSEGYTQKCMAQLADGLKQLRSAKIVHRDLKPANLLLSDGVLKIADFGFARNLPSHNLADTLCGSPLYMAPEVLQRKKYDARADLWSVGVILYEMLVGKTPFEGQNYIHLMNNIETKPLKIPKSVANRVSKPCLDLLLRLLQRDPHRRITFDDFFQHPFIKEPLPHEALSEATPSSENDARHPMLTLVEIDESKVMAIGEDEEFTYSLDNDFVVVNRMGSEPDAETDTDSNASHLLRIADWVMGYADAAKSKVHSFFLALTSVQILQHLEKSETSTDGVFASKKAEAVITAQEFSDGLDGAEAEREASSVEIYGTLYKDAIVCAQKAAADELCGQYCDSRLHYFRSIELLTFLINEGSGVALDPPLKLSDTDKEKFKELINQMQNRREKCAPKANV